MTALDLSIPFGLGLVSSLHCTQMCGPIVLAYSLPLQSAGGKAVRAHLSYNLGRVFTYSMMGAAAGAAGGSLMSIGRMAGIERTAAIVAGALMVLAAILMTGWLPKRTLIGLGSGPSPLSRVGGRLLRSATAGNKLLLGMVLGLLPCGMVYAALLKALDAGSAAGGAATMLAFGLGTSGALLGVGMFSTAITARFGKYANVLAAVSVAFTGAFLLYRGLMASTPGGAAAPSCHGHS